MRDVLERAPLGRHVALYCLTLAAACARTSEHAQAVKPPQPAEQLDAATATASEPANSALAADGGSTRGMPLPDAGRAPAAPMPTPDASAPSEAPDERIPPEVRSHADDWPVPNRDYDNTRNAHTRISSDNIPQLREAWRAPVTNNTTAFGYVTSNPLILGNAVYLQDMQSNVYALARDTGKLLWKRSYEQPSFGPNGVAIGWGKLFTTSSDSELVALDLQSGADVWKLAPELGHSEGMDIQPLVYDGQLFAATVPVSQTRGIYEGSAHGMLLAIDAQTGKQRWAFDTIDSPDTWGDPAANGGGGAWYPPLIVPQLGLSFWGTGNPVPWPGSTDKPNGGSRPGPNLYTSSLVALRLDDGTRAWHYQDQPHDLFDWDFQITPVRVRAAAQSGSDMVIGAGKTGAVAALDAGSGKLLWRTKVGKHMNDELREFPAQSITIFPGVLGGVMSALAYADGVLYVPSVDLSMSYDGNLLLPNVTGGSGSISALDVHDGKILWEAKLNGACYGAATLANDLVLTSDENGRVYALARASGEEVWHFDAPGGINAPLVAAGDDLLLSVGLGDAGQVIALRLGASGASAMQTSAPGTASVGPATWSGVYRDVLQGCSAGPTCHAGTLAGQLQLSTSTQAYAALVSVKAMGSSATGTSCSATGLLRVAPRDPDASLLVQKLEAATPACGEHMPPGGMLRKEQLQQLRAWIAAGARND